MKIGVWIEAARLRTLPASLIPVLTGGALAWNHGCFLWHITGIALVCALLIQIATNFANDYYDFRQGADNQDRVGFRRATSGGLVSPDTMYKTALFTFFIAFLLGLYLVFHAGWPVLIIGLLSITAGILYTGGPYPLAYNGLGEIFVFLFFGIAAVMGTYYVNTLTWSADAFRAAVAVGALSTMILVVNNYRDIHTDKKAGKRTLAVLLGEQFSKWQFSGLVLIAFAVPLHFFFRESYSLFILLPCLLLPWALVLIKSFWKESNKEKFNGILVQTAQFMTFFGILFSLGIVLS